MTATATDQDRAHLRRALALAERGVGHVSPNPPVGAVVVGPDGDVIGEGWHAELGGVHAEVAALTDAREKGNDPAGATIYVSLEPCAHQGRQPPCTDAILAAGIGRVVIGTDDPTDKASGRGPGILRDDDIEVVFADGAEATAARQLVQAFRKHATTGRPLVTLKSALSLDGFTATSGGDSKWISAPESRALVHRWRAEADAVAVGIGTVLADDPLLTARDVEDPDSVAQPARVVFDSNARLPLGSKLIASIGEAPLYVVVSTEADPGHVARLRDAGAEVIAPDGGRERRLEGALTALGGAGIASLLVEGGAELAGSLLVGEHVDQLRMFIAPILLGSGRPLAIGVGGEKVADAIAPLSVSWEPSGPDMLASARLKEW